MATKEEQARQLAQMHYNMDSGLKHVFTITGSTDVELEPDEPIKLLEVNQDSFPSGILPLQFGPSPASGVYFPYVIVEVTPEEFTEIKQNPLKLPHGWQVGPEIPRPIGEGDR
jgi:hypothetical protein